MGDRLDEKSGKSEAASVTSNTPGGAATSESTIEQPTQHSTSEKEKLRDQNSESEATEINDDAPNGIGKQDTETVPVPKDAGKETDEDAALAHLPDHEAAILKEQLHIPDVKVSFIGLYRYATTNDLLILALSAICAIAGGAIMPLFTVCWQPISPHPLSRAKY